MLVEVYIDVLAQLPSLSDAFRSEFDKSGVRIFKIIDLHVLPFTLSDLSSLMLRS